MAYGSMGSTMYQMMYGGYGWGTRNFILVNFLACYRLDYSCYILVD